MSRFKLCLLFSMAVMCATVQSLAQTNAKEVDEYNVPKEIDVCVKNTPGTSTDGELNPFYLTGDFDGDGKLDFAVQVIRWNSKGILICLSKQKNPILVGAKSSVLWPATQPCDSTRSRLSQSGVRRCHGRRKLTTTLSYCMSRKRPMGCLYWDGTALRWKQLAD
ncbi:MAG: hypothetical protein JWO91_1708 [Acidobacteriaceae bacterium]|jgi:hypothetical protein|nr:hypothetical protein [Acidobacteriaceae bacterium]